MDSKQHQHLMLKIVIGSAWVDRHLEPAEVDYLHKLLKRYHQDHDSELLSLLETPVPPPNTEQWLVSYLRDTSDEERLQLLANIGNLLIADQEVSEADHQLLDNFHTLMGRIPSHPESAPTLVEAVGQFVRQVVRSVSNLASP